MGTIFSQQGWTPLADVTNETNATNYYYFPMRGYKYFGIEFIKVGGADVITVTVEATFDNDSSVAYTSYTYQDITNARWGVASVTSTTQFNSDTPYCPTYVRVKTVTSGGANDGDYKVRIWRSA
jgi:hypothetical protein